MDKTTRRVFRLVTLVLLAIAVLISREIGRMVHFTLYQDEITTWAILPTTFGTPVEAILMFLEVAAAVIILNVAMNAWRSVLGSAAAIIVLTAVVFLVVYPVAQMLAVNFLPYGGRETLPATLAEWLPRYRTLETLAGFYGDAVAALLMASATMLCQWGNHLFFRNTPGRRAASSEGAPEFARDNVGV